MNWRRSHFFLFYKYRYRYWYLHLSSGACLITLLLLYPSIFTGTLSLTKYKSNDCTSACSSSRERYHFSLFVDSFLISHPLVSSSLSSSSNQNAKTRQQKKRRRRLTKKVSTSFSLYQPDVYHHNNGGSDCCKHAVISVRNEHRRQGLRKQCQQRQLPVSKVVTVTSLYNTIPLSENSVNNDSTASSSLPSSSTSPSFIIERISKSPIAGERIFKIISDLCIDVFFKELLDPSGNGNINFVKEWQINYLKNLQAADLRRRRERCTDTNEMFLAYEVKRVTKMATILSEPLLLDDELLQVFNLEKIRDRDYEEDNNYNNFVRCGLVGFVEVTLRPYGLGTQYSTYGGDGIIERPVRPVLTNLAVQKNARRYGIGTKLVDACEKHVHESWDMNEIILEVEDYNTKGLQFYRQRGFQVLFSDPASRRYDIDSSWWLKKVRCRREIMRKQINNDRQRSLMESADDLVRKIRESVRNF